MTPDRDVHHEEFQAPGVSLERSEADLAEVEDQLRVIRDDDGRVAAQEILQTISRLMGTLDTERKVVLMAEEHRRGAEIENARLQAELRMEQELRRRAEAALAELKGEIEQRKRRAEAELGRLWASPARDDQSPEDAPAPEEHEPAAGQEELGARAEVDEALAEEQSRRERVEAELQRASMESEERKQRALEELDRRRGQGASEESLERFKDGLERLLGEELDEPPHDHTERSLDSIWTPQATASGAADEASSEEEALPLPPGWRYASDLAADDKGRRWGRRRRARR